MGFGRYVGACVLGVGAEGVGHGGLRELKGVSGALDFRQGVALSLSLQSASL